MGVKVDCLEIEGTEILEFCVVLTIRNRFTNYKFMITTVYGRPITTYPKLSCMNWTGYVTGSHYPWS